MTSAPARWRLALVAVAVLAGWPTNGWASWPASYTVMQQLAADTGITTGCMQAQQSTVDAAWVVIWSHPTPACHHIDDGLVLHHRAGHWRPVAALHDPNIGCPFSRRVPADVASDLTLCSPPRTSLLCRIEAGQYERYQPSTCDLRLPDQASRWFADLSRMQWQDWGAETAFTTATITTPAGHRVHVVVDASRRHLGCGQKGHDYVYTRLRIESRTSGTKTQRMPDSCHVPANRQTR